MSVHRNSRGFGVSILPVVTFPSSSLSLPAQRCQKTPQRWDCAEVSLAHAVCPQEESLRPQDLELRELKESLQDTQPVGVLVDGCRTLDQVGVLAKAELLWLGQLRETQTLFPGGVPDPQAKAVLKFIEAISEKTLRSTVALTAARGRGKSAALGLAIAGAVAFG